MSTQRDIRIIVGFSPGSLSAKVAGLIAPVLARELDTAVGVELMPGDNGARAAAMVAAAPPDGTTLFVSTLGTHAAAPSLRADLAYRPLQDFTPVTLLASAPLLLVACPRLAADSVAALVDHNADRGATLACASSETSGAPHLAATLFASRTGVRFRHVEYNDTERLFDDLIAGKVDVSFNNPISAKPHIEAGTLRALAVTGCKRLSGLPHVPTLTELGIPGCEMDNWLGIVAPQATPPKTAMRLALAFARALNDRDVRRTLQRSAMTIDARGPAAFAEHLEKEIARWAALLRGAGAHAQPASTPSPVRTRRTR